MFIAFSDAGYIPNDTLGLKVSYITEAASDVVASFQNSFHSDLAAQAAVRLLLPYLSLHEQIRALISNILEHYTPTTGEYARTIVSLVREPLEHGYKSLELLESCTSVLMYVYKKYKTKGEAGPATVALLSGIELEDLVLPNRRLGVFHERLTEECHALSLTLLEAVGDKLLHNVVCEFQKARSMCHEFETYKGTFDCCEIVAVAALTHVVAIYQATVVPTDRKKDVGDRIIALLSKSANGLEDSTPITFHYPCLKIARTLTTECRLTCNSSAASTPFDLEGVTVLMQRQAGCAFWRRENTGDYDESDELMVLSLAHCQAIRAENAKKQQFVRRHDSGKSLPVKDSIQYANLSKMEPSERKQFVKKMMDFRY